MYFDWVMVLGGGYEYWSCQVILTWYQFSSMSSIYHLLTVSIDQYIAIMFPLYYVQMVTQTKVCSQLYGATH